MIELKDIKLLKVFQVDEYEYCNYLVYVFEDSESYSLYLQNKNYGIISLMYGVPKEQNTLEELLSCYNFDEYIKLYQEEYED